MRYVPNIIPDKSKVLRDYFKGDIYEQRKPNQLLTVLGWIFGVLFLICALVSISHPILALVFGLLGFLLLPPGHRLIERKLRFRLKTKAKSILVASCFIAAVPLKVYFEGTDKKEAILQKQQAELEVKQKELSDSIEQSRKDSLYYHIQLAGKLKEEDRIEEAIERLDYALAFAVSQNDKDQISHERSAVSSVVAFNLVKSRKYKQALTELNQLIAQDSNSSSLFYNRAICYNSTGKIREAVADCKTAIKLGNADAEKLHEKINPMQKRVSYYVTRCCDGSTSNAKGRGACSRHGGVCDWNEPVYEEYRKYE